MNIVLLLSDWKINSLSINRKDDVSDKRESVSLDVKSSFDFGDHEFRIYFDLKITNADCDITANAEYKFGISNGVIDEKFKNSSFPIVNAPAIAYPYLRAAIANITLQSGLRPIMLPSINFSKIAEEKAKSEVAKTQSTT